MKNNKNYLVFLLSILASVKHGKISLVINEKDFLSLEFKDKILNLKIESLEPLKSIRRSLKIPIEEKGILTKLFKVKELAEKLRNKKYTVLVTWREKTILVIGERAKPTFSRVILGSSIEVKDIKTLLSLLSQLK